MAGSQRKKAFTASIPATAIAALLLMAATIPAIAEVTPRGQRTADDIKYGDWRKTCFKAGGAKTLCRTSITGTYETGQTAVRLDLIEREGDHVARLQLFVPVAMFLQIPVKLSVDHGETYRLPYTWCLSNGCIAGDVASPGLIKAMETGKNAAIVVVDNKLLEVTTTLPLAQFGQAHKGPAAQTFEQDIDE
jgi:invasion protein IalB